VLKICQDNPIENHNNFEDNNMEEFHYWDQIDSATLKGIKNKVLYDCMIRKLYDV
jgi:hypothetical protein